MFDRNETHNSKGKQAFHSVFERSGYRFACRKRVKSKTLRPFRTRRRLARGLGVDGVAMIRHQLPLQTAFWRGDA